LIGVWLSLLAFGLITWASATSLIGVWLSLFFSTISTVVWLYDTRSSLRLSYFLLQESFTGVGVYSLSFNNTWGLFYLSLMMKLALPPFHGWFLKILFSCSEDNWLLSMSKLTPALWLFSTPILSFIFLGFVLSMVWYSLYEVSGLKRILFLSRCLNLFWGIILSFTNLESSVLWVVLYRFIVFILLSSPSSGWHKLLVVRGLPPSPLFFLKLSLILCYSTSSLPALLFLTSTFILFLQYFKAIERSSYSPEIHIRRVFRFNFIAGTLFLLLFLICCSALVRNFFSKMFIRIQNFLH